MIQVAGLRKPSVLVLSLVLASIAGVPCRAAVSEISDSASVAVLGTAESAAQDKDDHAPAPTQEAQSMSQPMQTNLAGMFLMNEASGTSMNPQSWPMPMLMPRFGSWNTMFMGQAFVVDTQQTGPRGADKFFSTNWFMTAAAHTLGTGSFMAQLMLSLEPATVTDRRYPELFQTGETAFGRPIVDGQHPHNLIMGLGFHYAHALGENTTVQIYFAPVGDPSLGPVAFPHRASALELPQAALGHHWEDSTHIADDVITVGIKHGFMRVEASGFYGTEPGENRWTIGYGPINSWSTRLSLFPTKNWMAQASLGRLSRPERQETGDVIRSTASVHYTKPLANADSWSSSLIWGRNHNTFTHRNLNSYLAETLLPIPGRNFLTGRIELTDKDELFANDPAAEDLFDRTVGSTFRIGAYTGGFTHDLANLLGHVETGIGANVTAYSVPAAIRTVYGSHPFSVNVYLRFRLIPGS
jgi:hypothetical protein